MLLSRVAALSREKFWYGCELWVAARLDREFVSGASLGHEFGSHIMSFGGFSCSRL